MMGGGLSMILFWAVVIAIVFLLVRWFMKQGNIERPARRQAALDLLEERYAKGDIDREEFEQKKRDLLADKKSG